MHIYLRTVITIACLTGLLTAAIILINKAIGRAGFTREEMAEAERNLRGGFCMRGN